MRAGTIVRLPDGREGTVVYHGLDGYGIKWGRHEPVPCPWGESPDPDYYEWFPDAMLRDHVPGSDLPCVGSKYTVIEEKENECET